METHVEDLREAVDILRMTRVEHLRALLETHEPLNPAGSGHRTRTVELLATAPDPFDRDDLEPGHVTASAFALSRDRTHVLLIHHRTLGRWLQPGGHVEPQDPDVVAAARRELAEEAGIVDVVLLPEAPGLLDIDVHGIPERPGTKAHLHFDVRFAFGTRSDTLRSGSDAGDARWVPIESLQEFAPGPSMVRVARRLLRGREETPTV